ncbi:MAG: NUDIX hydrolase, partial [Candidatus Bathyarchaeia archaeon]
RHAPPKAGYYSIPGGLVEVGEEVQEAAKREVLEETGLIIEVERLIDVIDNIVRDEDGRVKYHYVIVDYLAKPIGGELKKSSDAADVKWVRFSELNNIELTESAKRLFKKMGLINQSKQ